MIDLANKMRPKAWAEIIGQETIVSVLTRQIAEKKWKNSYLFCGSSGSGKTTTARLFANTINNNEGSPIEIDAASHNGIDDIRMIIADAQQVAVDCEFKVYIIDEAHQLTKAAWDAALKLIEEPPINSIFIFCTTNPDKIPLTIISRVQRFDFKKISEVDIYNRLEFICNEDIKCQYESNGLRLIAKYAYGNLRKALKSLEQYLDIYNEITVENVEKLFKLPNKILIEQFIYNIVHKDIESNIKILKIIDEQSTNLKMLYDAIINNIIDMEIYYLSGFNNNLNENEKVLAKQNNVVLKSILNRFIYLRKYIDDSNILMFLKTIVIEFGGAEK